jgi:hypothetical protein
VAGALLVFLLAAPGTISVRVEGEAREVVAYREGMERARAAVADGKALLDGLAPGAYDLRAEGEAAASEIVPRVRTAEGDGYDVRLTARRAHRVRVNTEPGARVWTGGVSFPTEFVLPEGMHRIVVDHPGRVSSAERILRVAGPTEVEVPLEEGLTVAGRVTGPSGPVAGARVEVFADGSPVRRSAFADAQGAYAVAGFRGDVVSLRVTAPGFADRLRRVPFDPFTERARCDVDLVPGSSVAIEVAGEAILLPDWYEVVLEEPRLAAHLVPARADGPACRFTGLVPGAPYVIVAEAPGFRPRRADGFVAPPAGETLALPRLALERGASLRGRATAGAVVVSQGPEGTLTCRADRQGRFEFPGLDPGERILWVRDVDESGTPVTLAAGEERTIDLPCSEPPPERQLGGLVFDADGKPLPGVLVESMGRRATTDGEGVFRLDPLPRGPGRVMVTFVPGPGCRALAEDPHLPFTERKATPGTEVRVQLERAGRLWLRLDPGERQLARATLHLASGATGLRLARRLPRRATEVVIDDIAVGPYAVEVAAPGILGTGGAVVKAEPSPGSPSRVEVLAGRTIRGRVLLRRWLSRPGNVPAQVDTPLDAGFVALLDGDPLRRLAVAPLEADGTFVLDGLPSGPVTLCAGVPGLPVAAETVTGDTVEIHVEEAAQAAIIVTGHDGTPLPGARVHILTEDGVDVRDLAANGRFRGVVAGDEDVDDARRVFRLLREATGRIAAPFLQPGSYRFVVAAEGHETQQVGVRARTADAWSAILEGFGEGAFPSGMPDFASPVRLSRAKD